jgi:hypothetical protein
LRTNPSAWKTVGNSTKGKCTIEGLTSGARYTFRVATISAAGQSPWSMEAQQVSA